MDSFQITPTNCYLTSLAISDSLFFIATTPVEIAYLYTDEYVFGPIGELFLLNGSYGEQNMRDLAMNSLDRLGSSISFLVLYHVIIHLSSFHLQSGTSDTRGEGRKTVAESYRVFVFSQQFPKAKLVE